MIAYADYEGDPMEAELFLQYQTFRSDVYKLLAECYYPPDKALSGKIVDLVEKLGLVCPPARKAINGADQHVLKADNLEDLTVEFARLFVGPYNVPAPPYGSVYMEPGRRIMGNSTLDVVKQYRRAGLDLAEDFKDAPDHIAAELEFMHFLTVKEVEAASQGDIKRLVDSLLSRQAFLEVHLGAWVSKFTRAVTENAKNAFYKYLALATEIFIKNDIESISYTLSVRQSDATESSATESFRGQP